MAFFSLNGPRVLPSFRGLFELQLGYGKFYWVLLGSNSVMRGTTGFPLVSLDFTRFYSVVANFTRFLLVFTGFYWVLLGFTGFY